MTEAKPLPAPPTAAAIVAEWLPLARGLARRRGAGCPWLVDCLESAAVFALWRVAARVERGDLVVSPGRSFAGLAFRACRWAMRRVLAVERARHPAAFVPQALGDEFTLLDLAADEAGEDAPAVGGELEAAEEVAALLAKADLPPRHRDVLLRVHGRGESPAAIAAEQGCSAKRVRQIASAALARVRAAAA